LGMSRTIWFALFCVVGLGAAVAIRTAGPFATPVAATADESNIEPAAVPNELTKSDRLPLPSASVATEASLPPAPAITPAETAPDVPETIAAAPEPIKKVEHQRWQDANAKIAPTEKIVPAESSRRHVKRSEPRKSAGTTVSSAKTEVWHCRRDAMGSLLRSLDLSPRCDL
jgi:type IV secretory pathway VirB10-like protein